MSFIQTLRASACLVPGLLLLVPALQAQLQPIYPGLQIPTGYAPLQTAVADLNGDGRLDLVSVDNMGDPAHFGGGVAVNLATGGLAFAPTVYLDIAASQHPTALAVGDFNEDGRPDLLVASYLDGLVLIALGDGGGGFGGSVPYAVAGGTQAIAVADLNHDGHLDFVTAEFDSAAISVRLGNGVGGFGPLVSIPVGGSAEGLALGDVDGDGHLDAAVAVSGSGKVALLLGNGAGGFAAPVTVGVGLLPVTTALADLDANGSLDLVWANFNGGTIVVKAGLGDGTFGAAQTIGVPAQPYGLAVGDFDGTSGVDIAVTGASGDVVTVLAGDGSLGFTHAATVPVGKRPIDLATADFDGDGILDLAATTINSDGVSLVLTGSPPPAPPLVDAGGSFLASYRLGDLNGDGNDDLVVANLDVVRVALADGLGGFLPFASLVVGTSPAGVAIGELNGDGLPDLAVTSGDQVFVVPGDGTGGFGAPVGYATQAAPGNVRIGDLDRDGDNDLVTQNGPMPDVGKLNVLLNNGAGVFGPFHVFPSLKKATLLLADITGDGALDAIVTSEDSNAFAIAPGNGAGAFGALQLTLVSSPHGSDVGDFDGDGLDDFAVALTISGEVRVFHNTGGGVLVPQSVALPGAGPTGVRTADADGDGLLDLLTSNRESGSMSLVHGDGALGFGPVTSYITGPDFLPAGLEVGDVNGDGAPEALVRDQFENTIALLLNHGPMIFASLGDAKAGVAGLPLLAGAGSLAAGSPTTISLGNAAPNAVVAMFVSVSSTPVPFVGGVLHAFPIALTLALATGPAGTAVLVTPWPAGIPSGTQLVVQDAIADAAATNGVALSNALQITVP